MAKIPTKIGKYPIEAKVAEGGMGAVYKGVHPTLNRPVILKRLTLKNSEHLTERFRREARMMMNFKNENIVNFYDHFKAGDSYYIVLEYIDGSDLNNLLTRERYLNCDLALYIFRESCKALKYAHKHQVIHRDIKPANIMFNSSGEVKLVDFGVAHEGTEEEAGLTTDGMTVGTPSYMAPEQFQSSRNVDARADIYSMGVMLYQMVTGKKPFPGGYSPELIAAIQKNKYIPPRKLNPEISPLTAKIIRKCMRGKADKRYKSVDEILTLLDRYFRNLDEMAIVEELQARIAGEDVPEKKKRKIRLGRMVAIGGGAVALLAAGTAAWWFGLFHEFLFTNSYGRLNLEIHVTADYKEYDQIYRNVAIFVDDDNTIPDVDKNVIMRHVTTENGDIHSFKSLPLYLESGRYRLKIQVEDLLYWYTVYLPPRNEQKADPSTEKGEEIVLEIMDLPVSTVDVNWQIKDCFTKANVARGTVIKIFNGTDWVNYLPGEQELLSGKVHKFRFERAGYYPKEYSLKVYPFQKELTIEVIMTPVAATVQLNNKLEKLSFSLNGDNRYVEGSSVGTLTKLPELVEGANTLKLTPGIYLLEFKSGRKTASIELDLEQGERYSLSLGLNADESELLITEE
ncbi:MAG: serine/threonine-protein kinase [Spirochaetales bacterium]|nr:serine/threonine-protein kinase [Spirochaetales bacterium]